MLNKIIDFILLLIDPTFLIPKSHWRVQWFRLEKNAFVRSGKILTITFIFIYLAHYYLVDIPAHKVPIELWANYRFSAAGIWAIALICLFYRPINESKLARLPVFLAVCYSVYMQGQSMEWRPDIPFFYVPILAVFGTFFLRLPALTTVLLYLASLATAVKAFTIRPEQTHHMISATFFGAIVLIVAKSRIKGDIEKFVLGEKNTEMQKELIETQMALNEQIKVFLPKEIYNRVQYLLREKNRSPLEAIDEVLRPKKCLASVLYSDIRGFTKMTKLGDEAILKAIIPAQKMCTDTVEEYGGIPRLYGDLVYTYFDDPDPIYNLHQSLRAAAALGHNTSEMNHALENEGLQIQRYAIIAFGEVIVGNLGGTEGSKDISVLGNAANLPSRLDLLTKEPSIKPLIIHYPVILSIDAVDVVSRMYPGIEIEKIILSERSLAVKDFPDEKTLNLLRLTPDALSKIAVGPDYKSAQNTIMKKYPHLFEDLSKPKHEAA